VIISSKKGKAEERNREEQAVIRLLLLDICNISPQLFAQKMWVLFALHLCKSSVVLLESRSNQNVLKGYSV
jgi:hypothetical protein